jgi:hypothetical protein
VTTQEGEIQSLARIVVVSDMIWYTRNRIGYACVYAKDSSSSFAGYKVMDVLYNLRAYD